MIVAEEFTVDLIKQPSKMIEELDMNRGRLLRSLDVLSQIVRIPGVINHPIMVANDALQYQVMADSYAKYLMCLNDMAWRFDWFNKPRELRGLINGEFILGLADDHYTGQMLKETTLHKYATTVRGQIRNELAYEKLRIDQGLGIDGEVDLTDFEKVRSELTDGEFRGYLGKIRASCRDFCETRMIASNLNPDRKFPEDNIGSDFDLMALHDFWRFPTEELCLIAAQADSEIGRLFDDLQECGHTLLSASRFALAQKHIARKILARAMAKIDIPNEGDFEHVVGEVYAFNPLSRLTDRRAWLSDYVFKRVEPEEILVNLAIPEAVRFDMAGFTRDGTRSGMWAYTLKKAFETQLASSFSEDGSIPFVALRPEMGMPPGIEALYNDKQGRTWMISKIDGISLRHYIGMPNFDELGDFGVPLREEDDPVEAISAVNTAYWDYMYDLKANSSNGHVLLHELGIGCWVHRAAKAVEASGICSDHRRQVRRAGLGEPEAREIAIRRGVDDALDHLPTRQGKKDLIKQALVNNLYWSYLLMHYVEKRDGKDCLVLENKDLTILPGWIHRSSDDLADRSLVEEVPADCIDSVVIPEGIELGYLDIPQICSDRLDGKRPAGLQGHINVPKGDPIREKLELGINRLWHKIQYFEFKLSEDPVFAKMFKGVLSKDYQFQNLCGESGLLDLGEICIGNPLSLMAATTIELGSRWFELNPDERTEILREGTGSIGAFGAANPGADPDRRYISAVCLLVEFYQVMKIVQYTLQKLNAGKSDEAINWLQRAQETMTYGTSFMACNGDPLFPLWQYDCFEGDRTFMQQGYMNIFVPLVGIAYATCPEFQGMVEAYRYREGNDPIVDSLIARAHPPQAVSVHYSGNGFWGDMIRSMEIGREFDSYVVMAQNYDHFFKGRDVWGISEPFVDLCSLYEDNVCDDVF